MRPDQFYRMNFSDFWLLWEGYNDGKEYEYELARTQTAILYYAMPFYGKGSKRDFDRLMPPAGGKKKPRISEEVKNRLKKLREEEALRVYNEKHGITIQNRG